MDLLIRYLSRQKLPRSMLQSRKGFGTDIGGDSEEDESKKISLRTEIEERKFKGLKSGPYIVGDLEVLKLGNELNYQNDFFFLYLQCCKSRA